MRSRAVRILTNRYYAAKIDDTGVKSISLTGGGFRRKVDVVPSFWYDSATYQSAGDEADRGIMVVDKNSGNSILNYPFSYMREIKKKSYSKNYGARMAIRLSKNVKMTQILILRSAAMTLGAFFIIAPPT